MGRIRSDASSPFVRHPHWRDYYNHKYDATKHRNIPFLLSFEQWLAIWEASGHLHERGYLSGQYVMARPGDRGPYKIGNVRIVTTNQNSREAKGRIGQPWSEEIREKISLSHRKLSPLSEAQVREIRRRYVYRSQHANTLTLADEYGVAQATIWFIVTNRSWKPEATKRR